VLVDGVTSIVLDAEIVAVEHSEVCLSFFKAAILIVHTFFSGEQLCHLALSSTQYARTKSRSSGRSHRARVCVCVRHDDDEWRVAARRPVWSAARQVAAVHTAGPWTI